ncbi:hypothetical protein JR316_0010465 [Psilocybe cubensis]|uniref:Uncharacterized protein n=2 Tax=Psilocybe cubensis TaxID=181762 RepID=A0A8H7XK99_PSICU|nr:hypothetical protein JR316_0010465 [Psilocybe cubensis]KAH9476553.1 hypothetical protein JR316_0010465 [Psilocybe cubensis]
MTSKARLKSFADDVEDAEVASLLEAQHSSGDNGQWSKDKSGDLDWSYTARTVRTLSHDQLLNELWEKGFSIPPREYNPSAPFVYVKMFNGEVVTLPHGYRLPLMFVARYYWGIALSKLNDVNLWKKERANVYHLSRLCENLFQRARAKAFAGGMEKGWRCVMFDRLLARFYKSWYRNDPPAGKEFEQKFSVKEYDRDVLKHDWKRWCTRGLNGVRMKEQEVSDGITIAEFRAGLERLGDGEWSLFGERLTWIGDDEELSWSSESELTEFEMDDEAEQGAQEEEEEEENADSDLDAEGDEVGDDDDDPTTHQSGPTDLEDAPSKRVRDLPIDEDENERATKRARIEMISDTSHRRHKVNNIVALTRTLAAMEKNPIWARNNFSGASGSGNGNESQEPRQSIGPTPPANPLDPEAEETIVSRPRPVSQPPIGSGVDSSSVTNNGTLANRGERPSSPNSMPLQTSVPRRFSSVTLSQLRSPSANASSSKLSSASNPSTNKPRRSGKKAPHPSLLHPSGSKPRQTRASQIAGVATVNVYVSDGKPRGGAVAHAAARAARKAAEQSRASSVSSSSSSSGSSRSPSPTPSASQSNLPFRSPAPQQSTLPPTGHTSTEQADTENTLHAQTGKWAAIAPPPPPPGRSAAARNKRAAQASVGAESHRPENSQEFITSEALKLLVNLVTSSRNEGEKLINAGSASSSSTAVPSIGTAPASGSAIDQQALEGRFQHFEGRFLSVKEELVGIVDRLQALEKEAREQREARKALSDKEFCDRNIGCAPEGTSQSTQTERNSVDKNQGGDEDVEMMSVEKESGEKERSIDLRRGVQSVPRAMGEIAIQTDQVEDDSAAKSHASSSSQSGTQRDTDIGSGANRNGPDTHSSGHCGGSETDTDSTLNAAKDETIDPCAAEMSSNLSLLVNNLVSVKMLSLVGDMVKGKSKDTSAADPDISIRSMSPVIPSSDSFAINNIMDEVKALKDEARAREQRDKEEIMALRQLHSAEVDALRRRLSYLESQSRYLDSDRYRSSSHHEEYHISAPVGNDHHYHNEGGRHSRSRQPAFHSASARVHRSPVVGDGDQPHSQSHTPVPDRDRNGTGPSSSSSSNPMPTPLNSERSFSFTRPGTDREDDIPLPIKSQRKHMFATRATFG